jgi:hypothetical protein
MPVDFNHTSSIPLYTNPIINLKRLIDNYKYSTHHIAQHLLGSKANDKLLAPAPARIVLAKFLVIGKISKAHPTPTM